MKQQLELRSYNIYRLLTPSSDSLRAGPQHQAVRVDPERVCCLSLHIVAILGNLPAYQLNSTWKAKTPLGLRVTF